MEESVLWHRDKMDIPSSEGLNQTLKTQENPPYSKDIYGVDRNNDDSHNSLLHALNSVHTYHKASDSSDQLMSMRFMHKPKRSSTLLEKSTDPTRANSLWNARRHQAENSDSDSLCQSPESVSSPTVKPEDDAHEDPETNFYGYKLVRKKSGELVKPSLKETGYFDSNIKRSKSLPTTPTFKLVHFGGDDHVRYFKKRDTPSAISASNSPALVGIDSLMYEVQLDDDDDDDDDDDEDYDYNELHRAQLGNPPPFNLNVAANTKYPNPHHEPLIEWELQLLNFGNMSYDDRIHHKKAPVFLERIYISVDRKYLLGHIAVENVTFQKNVTLRYTVDDWCTIIEIPTTYSPDRPNVLKQNNYDRFTFKVTLESLFNSFRVREQNNTPLIHQENKYSLCVRYVTEDHEYWDNNESKNYELKLIKKVKNPTSSKIQEHARKPRYSSSYLKRRLSDSKLEVTPPQLENNSGAFYQNDNSSSDVNDFVKNDFYMSSPMFTALSSNSDGKFKLLPDSHISPEMKTNKSFSPSNQPAPIFLKNNNESPQGTFADEKFKLNAKSYKDFLENYCFFSSHSTVDQDPIGLGIDESNNEKGSPTFTVSSLLGTTGT